MVDEGKEFLIRLTNRQREVLKALVELYMQNNRPISYGEIAQALQISRWTAYDIMQSIFRKGFVKIYYKPKRGPGRTEVLFIPKECAISIVSEPDSQKKSVFVRRLILNYIKKTETMGADKVIEHLVLNIMKERNPSSILLYTTALATVASTLTNDELQANLNLPFVFSSDINPPVIVSLIVEMNLAFSKKLVQFLNVFAKVNASLEELVSKFRENLYLAPSSSHRKILEFFRSFYNIK